MSVILAENHDAAYHAWRAAGVTRRTLVHVDAHHDMWWVPDSSYLTIANFVSLAQADDMVGDVVWVVPDDTWEHGSSRRALARHLRKLAGTRVPLDRRSATTAVRGKALHVCSLGTMPAVRGDILLDIDVDFFTIPRVSFRTTDVHSPLPWLWPGTLIERLGETSIAADLVTIAYSVEGGYTPLRWKYLGDDIAWRVQNPGVPAPGWNAMREGATAAEEGRPADALRAFERAQAAGVGAAPSFHLALLALGQGRVEEARQRFRETVRIDSSYRTPFCGEGFTSLWAGRVDAAASEFAQFLLLDPDGPYAPLGLALVAVRRRRWSEAADQLEAALLIDADQVDAHRAMGDVRAHQGRREEAIAAYERSLRLTLAGRRPIERPIATDAMGDRVRDPDHCRVHARLARLHASRGAIAQAINGYRIALAGGYGTLATRAHLAWLYVLRTAHG